MVARNETLIKWVLFAAAAALLCLLQGALQWFPFFGVIPFLYPMIVAVVAMLEGPLPGTVFGLVMGVLCDLVLPAHIPCFYTLIFPLAGLIAALLAQGWLSAGFSCAVVSSMVSFFLTDVFHAVILALYGNPAWLAAAQTALKETAVTLPFLVPVYLLLRAVHRKCHLYD